MLALLSTLQGLPEADRAEAERALLPAAREAAIGALAVEVAHDVGNALFGLMGLVDVSLDGTPLDAERERLIRDAQASVQGAFAELLGFARSTDDERGGELVGAVETALTLYRHGAHKHRVVEERLSAGPVRVACPRGLLLTAVVHLLLATEGADASLRVELVDGTVEAEPAGEESLHSLAASRIAADHGGSLEREGTVLRLRLPVESP